MSRLSERHIIKLMRQEYSHRLNEVMQETDVFDDRDNMVIGKDLKVHHTDSGLEYTVDDVIVDPESGKLQVVLRYPEEPRVDSAGEEALLGAPPTEDLLGEDDLIVPGTGIVPGDLALTSKQDDPLLTSPPDEETDEEVFVIDQEEFEKEYEVK